jgi:tRNA(Ile)-lysidine synthase
MRLFARFARDTDRAHIEAATIDHGLRPESRGEAELVAGWARDSGFAHRTLRWEGEKPKTRIQERARAARYELLAGRAGEIGADLIVTAHTLDDQAETVLMRLTRGSGVSGLAAMRPLTGLGEVTLARPFLSIAKARLVATCLCNGWPFLTDPSNANPRFERVRWRQLSTALAAQGLTAGRLAKLADRAASADDALETKAGEVSNTVVLSRSPGGCVLDAGQLLRREPGEIVLRVLLRVLGDLHAGKQAPALRLERAESLSMALRDAFPRGKPLKQTLGGAIFAFDGKERLTLTAESPRRRGKQQAAEPEDVDAPRRTSKVKKSNSNARLALV